MKYVLEKNDWLELAMEVLGKAEGVRPTIDYLCREVGVSKGSFYNHFRNSADFLKQIIAFWGERFTQVAMEHVDTLMRRHVEFVMFFKEEILRRNFKTS
jgi:AcrR family transcriptional regulator